MLLNCVDANDVINDVVHEEDDDDDDDDDDDGY